VIGGASQAYNATNIQNAINAIPGFAGSVTVPAAAATGFTVNYGGASAGLDVANFQIVNLSCGGCFASVEETTHGGANDSFTLNYNGNVSAQITNGVNYTAAGILAALTPLLPAGGTVTVAGFGGGAFNNTGFQVTYTGTLAMANNPVLLRVQDFTAGASGFTGETDNGGAVDNQGGPGLNVITNPHGQRDRRGRGPACLQLGAERSRRRRGHLAPEQHEDERAAVRNVPDLRPDQRDRHAALQLAGENHLTTSPTRVFPDLQQILDNNTNADSGACPTGPIAPPVPIAVKECFSEFLPTADYVGFAGVNASPLSLHFRLTARDSLGGTNSADTTLLLVPTAGPFRVTSPNTAVSLPGESTQTVTWDVRTPTSPR
jgi:hypothetical protein